MLCEFYLNEKNIFLICFVLFQSFKISIVECKGKYKATTYINLQKANVNKRWVDQKKKKKKGNLCVWGTQLHL